MERWLNLSGTRHLKWPDDVEILEPPEELQDLLHRLAQPGAMLQRVSRVAREVMRICDAVEEMRVDAVVMGALPCAVSAALALQLGTKVQIYWPVIGRVEDFDMEGRPCVRFVCRGFWPFPALRDMDPIVLEE